jgi:hypothetical protein
VAARPDDFPAGVRLAVERPFIALPESSGLKSEETIAV